MKLEAASFSILVFVTLIALLEADQSPTKAQVQARLLSSTQDLWIKEQNDNI
jgi:hypothetical protein